MKAVGLVFIFSFVVQLATSQQFDKSQLQGVWSYSQYDNYYEVIFTDSIIWSYTDEAGVWPFQYSVQDSVITRTHLPWGQQARPLTIKYLTRDSMSLQSSRAAVVYRRTNVDLDEATIQRLIDRDPDATSSYIAAYRQRSRKWLSQHESR